MQTSAPKKLFWQNPWRIAGWGLIIGLLLLPLIAMQFTAEVNWTGFDFVAAAVLLGGTGLLIELGCHYSRSGAGRVGWALVVLTSLLLIWMNLAVGIIGSEDNPANMLYFGVLASVVIGAPAVRFRAKGMSYVLYLTAALQMTVEVIIQLADLGAAPVLNLAFALLWLLAAGLLRNAATRLAVQPGSGA
ncbi:hypothetical protein [Arsukibacterium sp.]|uniref:hypothetical protein n=1 Tax=Arsukibacterium sp. TaxID=1977258 RepID=UPI00299E7742|nr:hypothetical protein [Arsukibacterium sp.]MDX1679015.1 hypothetical protein [Arsukibacterium sp.]